MSRGTPFCLKCPKCKRGTYGRYGMPHCSRTGNIERKISRSAHVGHGSGGSSFGGHRGEVLCNDCGHRWWSTHFNSGRVRCWSREECTHFTVTGERVEADEKATD